MAGVVDGDMPRSATDLAAIFVDRCLGDARDLDRAALGRALVELFDAARRRWPGIVVDAATVIEHLAQTWTPEGPTPATAVELPPFAVELVLARACLGGDPTASRAFHEEMFDRVDRVLARLGLSAADAEDVKQDVRAKLLVGEHGDVKLALYHGTGPLAYWIASVAGREALGLLRRRRPTEALEDDDLLADASDDPGLLALKSRHGADFKRAFQAAVAELAPRDRTILRALIVDDRSIGEIARAYGIHRVTASRWVSEIRLGLRQRTRDQLRAQLKLDASSLESAIRLVDSHLELSLYRLLADAS